MTPSLRIVVSLALAISVPASVASAQAPADPKSRPANTASTTPPTAQTPTLPGLFDDTYCGTGNVDKNVFLCDKKGTLPLTQKWAVLNGYCNGPALTAGVAADRPPLCSQFDAVAKPFALFFNHRTGTWTAEGEFGTRWRRTDFDDAVGTPTIYMGKGDQVGVVVTHTNPLLFRANRGDMKTEDAAEMKALQAFFTNLGNAFSTLAAAGASKAFSKLAATNLALAAKVRADWRKAFSVDAAGAVPDFVLKGINDAVPTDDPVALAITTIMNDAARANGPVRQLQRSIDELAAYRLRLLHTAHRLDQGPSYFAFPLNTDLERTTAWERQFAGLRASLSGQARLGGCDTLLKAATTVLTTAAEQPTAVSVAAARLNQYYVAAAATAETTAVECAVEGFGAWLKNGLADVTAKAAKAAATNDPNDVKALRESMAAARGALLQDVLVISRLMDDLLALRKDANEALGKEDDVRRSAENVRIVADRARDAGLRFSPATVEKIEGFEIAPQGNEARITKAFTCTTRLDPRLTMFLRTKTAPEGVIDPSVIATFTMRGGQEIRLRFRAGGDVELPSSAEGYEGCERVVFDVPNAAQVYELWPVRRLVISDDLWVMDEKFTGEFGKIRTTPIKVTLSSPFADAVPTDRSRETVTSFRIARRSTSLWSFGVGLIVTGVSTPSFGAVDDTPTTTTTVTQTTDVGNTRTVVTTPELKVVQETGNDPRTGSRAVFGTYRFAGRYTAGPAGGFGVQFGTATSTDFPAVFGGLSYNVGRYLVIGGGCSAQRVNGLDSSQAAGESRVPDAAAIRTRKTWVRSCKDAWYASFSFNLNSLSLF